MIRYFKNFFSLGISNDDFKKMKGKILYRNRKNLISLCDFSMIFLILLICVSLISDYFGSNIIPYVFALVACFFIYLYAKYSKRNIMPAVYAFLCVFVMLGILIGTVTNPESEAVCYIAFILIVPLILICKLINIIILNLISSLLFCILVFKFKSQSVWLYDISNCVIYGFISIIIGTYMMKIKFLEFKNELKIEQLAILDMMTGLFNRNFFEKNGKSYSKSGNKNSFCFYVDVNGLHELNNENGHEAGDKMLIFVGKTMKDLFANCDSYRIGGDEFMVCGIGKTLDEVLNIIDVFNCKIEEVGYSVSTGLEYQENADFNMYVMMKAAEEKMMNEKRAFYEKTSYSRRKIVSNK